MTAFRLNLGDRLLGERRGRDFHLVADLSTTKNLLNTKDCCIEYNSVAFFLCCTCSDKNGYDLIDLTNIQNISGDRGFMVVFESALTKNRTSYEVGPDKVVCIDTSIASASAVSCSTTILMGPTTTGA